VVRAHTSQRLMGFVLDVSSERLSFLLQEHAYQDHELTGSAAYDAQHGRGRSPVRADSRASPDLIRALALADT
jgi:hypothetical protein